MKLFSYWKPLSLLFSASAGKGGTVVPEDKANGEKDRSSADPLSARGILSAFDLPFLHRKEERKKEVLTEEKTRKERELDRQFTDQTQSLRMELADVLHNQVSTPLTHIKRFIEPVFQQFGFDPEVKENLTRALQILDRTHDVSQNVAGRISPEKISWLERIKMVMILVERKHRIRTVLTTGDPRHLTATRETGEKIGYLISHLVTRAAERSPATRIEINIDQKVNYLSIQLIYDGVCTDTDDEQDLELEIARSYIEELDGLIDIRTGLPPGTRTKINIPITDE